MGNPGVPCGDEMELRGRATYHHRHSVRPLMYSFSDGDITSIIREAGLIWSHYPGCWRAAEGRRDANRF